jgi:hydroxyethylthiazole kinase-like uncharacterized protein yjeF
MIPLAPGLRWPLMDVARSRQIESHWQAQLPPHTLMQRAGLACARLALAIAPHARQIWVACGPGNNGGDGLLAALELARLGKSVWVSWLGTPQHAPADSLAAWQALARAGLPCHGQAPPRFDLCIDALLGLGAQRPAQDRMAQWITHINQQRHSAHAPPVLSVDLPTGLNADTGQAAAHHVQATHTLSLLTLKPGLFTHQGRDASGEIWFDDLGLTPSQTSSIAPACAWLNPAPVHQPRPHAAHKGTQGQVLVIGGATGMAGALALAASAALHQGAGKVYACSLDATAATALPQWPEIMCRPFAQLPLDMPGSATVCGCGGGQAVARLLKPVLEQAQSLVLDADALNALAAPGRRAQQQLALLNKRQLRQQPSVLTPHPLEAARLLQCSSAEVQADRLGAARTLAERHRCVVVLKGSGTVIAAPGQPSHINPTGNPLLACAGTGDVLAGMIGARLAQGEAAFEAACAAVYIHGRLADRWADGAPLSPPKAERVLTASQLAVGS